VANLNIISLIAICLSAVLLMYENIIARQSIKNIDKAFFTLNGYISIMFCTLLIIDIIKG
jgi:4-hydroxybenzoate polyprenyltransferase